MRFGSFHFFNNRRAFLKHSLGLAAAVACGGTSSAAPPTDDEPSRLKSRRTNPTITTAPGTYRLGLDTSRDGFLYVPASYKPENAAPLVVLLHGAGQTSSEWSKAPLDEMFGSRGYVALGTDSRDFTWDILAGGFGPDVLFLDRALTFAYSRCNIDGKRIALCGFSDGGSYALSLGASNGDVFSGVIGLSPGFFMPGPLHGKPPIFIAHGTADHILPIDTTSRVIVPQLRQAGYDVTYNEFDGVHGIYQSIVDLAAEWFLTKTNV